MAVWHHCAVVGGFPVLAMSVPAITINESALLNGTSTTCAVGDVLIDDATTGLYVKATTANRGTRRSHGVALTAWAQSGVQGSVRIQTGGLIDAAITGLGAGIVSWVRVSATATLERVTPGAGDDIVGKCDVSGNLFLHVGTWDSANYAGGGGGGVTPTGTGFTHITGGAQDAAAKLVENADVAAGAAIAISKLADIAATDIVSGTLIHERGGLEADVSAYSGLVKISGGATSAVAPAAGVETFITTPSSANLASAVTDETGTGALVFADTPTLVTPVIGAATGTSLAVTGKVTAGGQAFSGGIVNSDTGTQHNIARAAVIRLTDGIVITGIDATGAADMELVLLVIPALATGVTFSHETGSSAGNQITSWTGTTINAYEKSVLALRYDLTATKWKFVKEGFA